MNLHSPLLFQFEKKYNVVYVNIGEHLGDLTTEVFNLLVPAIAVNELSYILRNTRLSDMLNSFDL